MSDYSSFDVLLKYNLMDDEALLKPATLVRAADTANFHLYHIQQASLPFLLVYPTPFKIAIRC